MLGKVNQVSGRTGIESEPGHFYPTSFSQGWVQATPENLPDALAFFALFHRYSLSPYPQSKKEDGHG